jgi:uncharacterized OB-fold protein
MNTSIHPFTAALRKGVLRYQRCTQCGHAQTPTRLACSRCGSAGLQWQDARGDGAVVAASVVSRAPSDEFRALVPYTLVLVQLAEGPCVMGHAAPGTAIGDAVEAGTVPHGERRLLRFSPISH